MPAYKLSELADEDIFGIVRYTIQSFGIAQARSYHTDLTRVLELLAQNPELGSECDWICTGMRRFQFKKHGIYLLVLEEGILVSRVLHHSIDIDAQDFPA
ncbi:type II toxin-antitoxin system RelE/ParE family toxin [Salmonella enterica]|nr:type II toxin-antitoxin system RelE/ParE family toxin [Salmonella enterica]EEH5466064.1 type II toxin-antitoxin system RelE/ParE family toxin [Salmonella enterica]EEH7555508.1 type II toxin-antitoxin system RelE/ParE family toxin [Salmonella enterica]EEO5639872.1 type II toxin-antitoxin system RelE/ParE family toxin [Salmonella enterica]EEQ0203841.1 type II toxin-antitoxin system RelE/ParE family toxin [Salmonella enterica]